jgi:hypothetical protein
MSGGVCVADGTCRPACDHVDGGDGYCVDFGQLCLPRTGHCVDKCIADDQCLNIDPNTYCNQTTGRCVGPADPCGVDSDCNSSIDPNDYCFAGGNGCYCSKDLSDAGICVRRRSPCQPCSDDRQCGDSVAIFQPVGKCLAPTGEDGGTFCLYEASGPCSCGYVQRNDGYCEPAAGSSCSQPGCMGDNDCPPGNVCNAAACHCEPRCRWDYKQMDLAAPGCPANETCWVDEANLDPTSIYYGAGRCRPPCNSDSDCTNTTTNPQGGPKLKCGSELEMGGAMSAKRCRANGCMDDLECPPTPDTDLSYGYCDRGSFVCKTDCRTGSDPVTMQPYKDCRPSYGCISDGGVNYCTQLTCAQQGGASIACRTGQYCCGEDKDNDGVPDPCPPTGLDMQNCYNAPSPPFCQQCMTKDDCQNIMLPPYLQGACANGSHSPSCSPYPFECYGYQNPATGAMVGVCAPATYNSAMLDSNGRRADNKGCPVGFSAVYQRITFTMGGDDYCASDSDCNVGTDAGKCDVDLTSRLADGGHAKACLCTVGSSVQQCPNQADAGIFSVCHFGNAGDTQACIETVSCMTPTSYVFTDAGCGL